MQPTLPFFPVLHSIAVAFPDRRSIPVDFLDNSAGPTFFVVGRTDPGLGREVSLDIAFAKERLTLQLRGTIRWRRLYGSQTLMPGIGVEVAAGSERALLALVQGGRSVGLRNRARRFRVKMQAIGVSNRERMAMTVTDISRSGAFIEDCVPPPVGTQLGLRLQAWPTSWIGIAAEVVRHATEPVGFGVRYLSSGPALEATLGRLLWMIERAAADTPLEVGPWAPHRHRPRTAPVAVARPRPRGPAAAKAL